MISFINKVFTIMMILVAFILPAQPDNAPVTVKEVTTQSKHISYTYTNKTNRIIRSSSRVTAFEKNIDGEWTAVEYCQAIPEVAYDVFPGQTDTASFKAENLTVGEYRLTISYMLFIKSSETVTGNSSVIFEVTE